MMNRNYDVDVDEDELDDELMEFEREIAKEKKFTNAQKNNQNKNNLEYGDLPEYGSKDVHDFMK